MRGTTAGRDTPESVGNRLRDRCNEVGLPKCSAHGLREAGARLLAEAGASECEVMSYLGDRSPKVANRYVAASSRAKMGTTGMAKLGTERARELTNLFGRLVNSEV